VRGDTANRIFATLGVAALVIAMFVLCGAVGCVLLALLVSRLADSGPDALVAGGHWVATVFVLIVAAGVLLGLRSIVDQVRASRALARRVRGLELPLLPELEIAADRAGLQGRVALVDSPECFSFAYGALTPRVAISKGLVDTTSTTELAAVLVHERYHVRNLDPLKVLLARAAPATFFYFPVLSALRARYVAGRELAADRMAVAACGRQPLASALLKVVSAPRWGELRAAAAIGGSDLLDVRLTQLEEGTEPAVGTLTRSALAVSILAGLGLAGLFVASVIAFGGPSAVTRATGTRFGVLDVAGGVLCAAPWIAGGALGYRWLARRLAGRSCMGQGQTPGQPREGEARHG
jgi:Zn-dependent protease with chaperone function